MHKMVDNHFYTFKESPKGKISHDFTILYTLHFFIENILILQYEDYFDEEYINLK